MFLFSLITMVTGVNYDNDCACDDGDHNADDHCVDNDPGNCDDDDANNA